ncbi:DUF378 domain-containing protein [Paenibacillus sp. GCM10027626]|uniref:DUF378 domain-containing protein n=1 Tax=Paenibacillus sp. GCM10027626 TaxID=3273411 RepID=UPI0036268745
MKAVNIIALIILIIGGLSWLLVGIFEWDFVSEIFSGSDTVGAKIIYIIFGLSALYALSFFTKVSEEK